MCTRVKRYYNVLYYKVTLMLENELFIILLSVFGRSIMQKLKYMYQSCQSDQSFEY